MDLGGLVKGRLIFDVGASEGDDSAFYLKKGFDVVAVEADQRMVEALRTRCSAELAAGRYVLHQRAAWSNSVDRLAFFADEGAQGHSRVVRDGQTPYKWTDGKSLQAAGQITEVQCIAYDDLVREAGIPYYIKIDIEGAEDAFISGIGRGGVLPPYVSAETHQFEVVSSLHNAGYRHFRLVNQTILNVFTAPFPPREGKHLPDYPFWHASGLFGAELPGSRWFSYSEIENQWNCIKQMRKWETLLHGWFDCHAHCPESLERLDGDRPA